LFPSFAFSAQYAALFAYSLAYSSTFAASSVFFLASASN
jgi:hypothetical protein